MKNILFWLNCSRLFSLPMTVMSWLVVFIYGYMDGGNILAGIIALIGISFAHLATNLFDDYIDYKMLSKDEKLYMSAHKEKCKYLKDGTVTTSDMLKVVTVYCGIALIAGIMLAFATGWWVIGLAIIGAIITLSYAKISIAGYSELAVTIAFGPLLFEGVYFVMTGDFSMNVFILSLAVVMFTVGLLYTHNLLDYDGDMCAEKMTLCCRIGDKKKALKVLGMFYAAGYIFTAGLAVKTANWHLFYTYLTVPLAVNLYKSMEVYIEDKNIVPDAHWWNYPLDNWKSVVESGNGSFYFRLFSARNVMMYFTLIMSFALIKLH